MKSTKYLIVACLLQVAFGSEVIHVNDDNWSSILEGTWMVQFYAPWCPACRNFKGAWNEFANKIHENGVKVASIDTTASPITSGRFLITALPSVFFVTDGVIYRYEGAKQVKDMMFFIEEKQWKETEPIPTWKSPSSIQMGVLGYFFKMSFFLQHVSKVITEDYQYPTWVPLVVFSLATIAIGGLMGLIAVLLFDLYTYLTSKKPAQPKQSQKGPKEKKND